MLLFSFSLSLAAEPPIPLHSKKLPPGQKGPHGGQIVSHDGKKFEIKLNQDSEQLDVYSSDGSQVPQNNLGITLYKQDKTGQTIRLKAVEPPRSGEIHYQGKVSPTDAPFVAFGIQLDLSPTPEKSPSPGPEKPSPEE